MITIAQLRAARALLGWSQDDLAKASGVSKPTIARLETGSGSLGGYAETRDKLLRACEDAGIAFLPENGGGVGVRMRDPGGSEQSR